MLSCRYALGFEIEFEDTGKQITRSHSHDDNVPDTGSTSENSAESKSYGKTDSSPDFSSTEDQETANWLKQDLYHFKQWLYKVREQVYHVLTEPSLQIVYHHHQLSWQLHDCKT